MHGYNVWVPGDSDAASRLDNPFSGVAPFDLAHAMTELMTPGISLPEVAATVTSNLAHAENGGQHWCPAAGPGG